MKLLEIERKYTVKTLPQNLDTYPCCIIEQGYLNTNPVIRVRKQDDTYSLTYKGDGMMTREEYTLPLNEESYNHLIGKTDGNIITKKRYLIPLKPSGLTIELDIFNPPFSQLVIAEVEFPSEAASHSFTPPDWFLEDVTFSEKYHNSYLSKITF